MKLLVNILLLIFLSFLATPTIVSLVQDDADVSVAYNLNEEEVHKELQEIKAGLNEFTFSFMIEKSEKKSQINTEYLLRHKLVFGDIFLPPPEQNII
ncbi:hypothetical protein GCM10007424_11930 [Flavobacterium suaedae]|uniref:Uncharacterized protein n=1 Tax=Flavobacterium suaedae TaxID=1767027 RepID=A0ABQ1JSI4_9FLAO|nr:hypothetical protein [Flavobacterium suaedae]GGB73651.1 hypothetical protein GCM10007424_11930 [Flavobacterium suaedae]